MNAENSVLGILKKILSIPSPYPYEVPLVEWIEKFLKSYNFRITRIPVEDRFEIVASKGMGNTLLLFGHLDTVPIQGAENLNPHVPKDRDEILIKASEMGWVQDPYTPIEKDGKIYASGAIDMKAGDAAILFTAATLPEPWFENNCLKIAFTVDEEYIDKGMYAMLQADLLHDVQGCISCEILDTTSAAMTGETPDSETILLGRRGRIAIETIVKGKAAHGSTPIAGINAIEEAARMISSIKKGLEVGSLHLSDHPILPKASMTSLEIKGGTSSLSIPDKCTVIFDRHFVPPETANSVLEDFRTFLNSINPPIKFTLRKTPRSTPFLLPFITSKDTKIVQSTIKAMKNFGMAPVFTGGNSVADENMLASSEYPFPLRREIPTIIVGCKGGRYHQANEWVDLNSLDQYAKLLREICLIW
ncbi:MAG: M20 family metallopeptidase [Promethearchaeota archaeon]